MTTARTRQLCVTLPLPLWQAFKATAHAQGVTYSSLAVACIQTQLWPDLGQPILEPFGREAAAGGEVAQERIAP